MRYFLKSLVLPPALNFLGILAALLLWRSYPRVARGLMVLSLGSLWLLSTPWVSELLIDGLENNYPPLDFNNLTSANAGAIVILTGGRLQNAPDFGGNDTVASSSLERARYGARLYRRSELPILVSGGRLLERDEESLADLVAQALTEDFGVPVRWRETRSTNTWENAVYSREMLAAEQIDSIVLVTHAWHMPRAVGAFEQAGFAVLPAPTAFRAGDKAGAAAWIPSATALGKSADTCHEWLGRLYYALFY